jgi:hypothetical protein
LRQIPPYQTSRPIESSPSKSSFPKASHRIEPLRSRTTIRFGGMTCCVIWRRGSYPSSYAANAIPSLPRTRRSPVTTATAFLTKAGRARPTRGRLIVSPSSAPGTGSLRYFWT